MRLGRVSAAIAAALVAWIAVEGARPVLHDLAAVLAVVPGRLVRSLAELQAAIYGRPAEAFVEHGRRRAEAMAIRDAGGDWGQIARLLDGSWVSLRDAVR
jgi:hypothetical protein